MRLATGLIPEISVEIEMKRSVFFRPEYSGSPLEIVHPSGRNITNKIALRLLVGLVPFWHNVSTSPHHSSHFNGGKNGTVIVLVIW